jgi:hypothetical protein
MRALNARQSKSITFVAQNLTSGGVRMTASGGRRQARGYRIARECDECSFGVSTRVIVATLDFEMVDNDSVMP